MQHAATSGAPLVELQAPCLLEDVDDRVGVGAHTDRAAGIRNSAKWTNTIAKVTLCGRARADGDAVAAEQGDVVVIDVDCMHGGQIRPEYAFTFQELGRRAAFGRQALLHLGRLLREVDVKWRIAIAGPAGDGAHRLRIDRSDAVDRCPNANPLPVFQLIDARRPPVCIAV